MLNCIDATRAGHRDALAELYAEHAPMVRRVAYRILGNADDAEDIVQDVFVGMPEALRHYEERGTFSAWLHLLATRTALLRLRTMDRRRERRLGAADDFAGPSTTADAIAARLTLAQMLARLPEELRIVFVLKEMEGHSHAEVARLLGIRTGTSEVRLHRAFKRLRHIMESSV